MTGRIGMDIARVDSVQATERAQAAGFRVMSIPGPRCTVGSGGTRARPGHRTGGHPAMARNMAPTPARSGRMRVALMGGAVTAPRGGGCTVTAMMSN